MAKYVMMTMLALDRDLFRQDRNLRRGEWEGSCITGPPRASEWEQDSGHYRYGHIGQKWRGWPRRSTCGFVPYAADTRERFGSVARRLGFPGRGLPLVRGNKRTNRGYGIRPDAPKPPA